MANEKILIIDDDPLVIRLAELIIKNINLQPLSALKGEDGIEVAIKERPALIILDLMMPEMNGWETLSQIRKTECIQDTPVIILTARVGATGDLIGTQNKPHYEAFLPKPFSMQEMRDKINEILNRAP